MRRIVLLWSMLAAVLVAGGCAGEAGPAGDKGARGETGETGEPGSPGAPGETGAQGPAGPLNEAPRIHAIAPESGSYANTVVITGANFSTVAGDNLVYFDGEEAEVVSATETELVVRPWGAYVSEPRGMSVTVITNNQASNHHGWTAVPSGSRLSLAAPFVLVSRGMAFSPDQETLYLGDRANGVLAVDVESGRTTWLRRAGDGIDVVEGIAVHPLTGEVYVVDVNEAGSLGRIAALDPNPEERAVRSVTQRNSQLANAGPLTFDNSGNLYVLIEQLATHNIGRLGTDGSWSLGWGTLAADVDVHGVTQLGTRLYVSAGTAGIFRFDLATGGSVAAPLGGSAGVDLKGIVADPSTATLLVSGAFGVKRFDTAEPVTSTDYSTAPLAAPLNGAHGLARDNDGTVYIFDGEAVWSTSDGEDLVGVTAPNVSLGFIGPAFAAGALYFGSQGDLERCADRGVPLMRVIPGEALEPVSHAFCGVGVDSAPDGRIIGVHASERVVRAFDPATGEIADIVDVSDAFDNVVIATAADEYVYFVGTATGGGGVTTARVRLDGTGLESAWLAGTIINKARPFDAGLATATVGNWLYIETPDDAELLLSEALATAGFGLEQAHDGDSVFVSTVEGDVFEILPDGAPFSVRHHALGGLTTYGMTKGTYGDLWTITIRGIMRITP